MGDPGEDRGGDNKCQEAAGTPEGARMGPVGFMVRRGTEVTKGAGNSLREVVLL